MSIYNNSSFSSSFQAQASQPGNNLHSQNNASMSSLLARRFPEIAKAPKSSSESLSKLSIIVPVEDYENIYNSITIAQEKNLYDFPPPSPFGHN